MTDSQSRQGGAGWSLEIRSSREMEVLGMRLGRESDSGLIVYLSGDLGAGKTTLVRGFLRGLGHMGPVRSPTFTLVEPYELEGLGVYHFDLYRLSDPEELEFLGFRDYLDPGSVCLIEWPQRGQGLIPEPDLLVTIAYSRSGRRLELVSRSTGGMGLIRRIRCDNKL